MENTYIDQMAEQEISQTETGLSFELRNLINIDKAGIKDKVDAVVTTIHEGWTDPLDALIFAKKGVELFSALEKNVRGLAEEKSIEKNLVRFGTEITEKMNGVSFDFAACGDPIYEDLKAKADKIGEELKARQEFLKNLPAAMDIVINEAEVYNIKPPIKSGKLGFTLKIQ